MKIVTRFLYINFFLLFSIPSFCQDLISKRNGMTIEAKVEIIDRETIKYKVYKNQNGPIYIIDKVDVSNIKFENGTFENFQEVSTSKKLSKSELREFIVKSINEHGYEEDTFNRRYSASFEEDYLRLIVLRKSGEPCNDGLLYDFSNVYKFQKVSKRSDKLAFINIFVSIAKNKKKTKWDKHKLVMRVDNPTNAEMIVNALKDYNSILISSSGATE